MYMYFIGSPMNFFARHCMLIQSQILLHTNKKYICMLVYQASAKLLIANCQFNCRLPSPEIENDKSIRSWHRKTLLETLQTTFPHLPTNQF